MPFEKHTAQAAKAVADAEREARLLNSTCIGAEHLLVGLIDGGGSAAGRVLRATGISRAVVRERLGTAAEPAEELEAEQLPFDPRARRVLEVAQQGWRRRDRITTADLLCALIEDGRGVAVQILTEYAPDLDGLLARLREAPDDRERGEESS